MKALRTGGSRLLLILLAIVCGTVLGCGDDDNDFLVSRGGSGLSALGGTGSLLFTFATAQSAIVPSQSNSLVLEFFAENRSESKTQDEPIFRSEQPFAGSVVVSEVPVEAKRVLITVYDADGRPLAQLTDEVVVQAGQTSTVDLSDAEVTELVPTGFRLQPEQGEVSLGQTLQFEVLVSYSNGDQVSLTADQVSGLISFEVRPTGIAKIDRLGRLTPLSIGSTHITATSESLGSFRASIQVTES